MEDHSNDSCPPEWDCEWFECAEDELLDTDNTCSKEICTNECGDEKCKFWHAEMYDYVNDDWLWQIEDCP